jgi:hypothetical protein
MIKSSLEQSSFSSAGGNNPEINFLLELTDQPDEDFESDITTIIKEQTKSGSKTSSDKNNINSDKLKKTVQETKLKTDEILSGNLGDIKKLSTEQFSNLQSVATNPFGFITKTLLRKLNKGAGVLFIVAIAIEVSKFLVNELFKPGRLFDMRFREQIDKQIIQFLNRKEQEELRAGYKSLITTTIGGLRGGSLRGQIGGNFYSSPTTPGSGIYDPSYIRFPSRNTRDMRNKDITTTPANLSRSNRWN